jgi:XTP/dITP diphosphohydrolase
MGGCRVEAPVKWVVATRNADKLREIRQIFGDLSVSLVDLDAFPDMGPVEETGTTLRENALIKARLVHAHTGLPTIADDTGLEVDGLGGAPGIYAARFAGKEATYRDNWEKLLNLLEEVPRKQRTARFRTCAVFMDGQLELTTEGVMEGSIARKPRGENGFGYDPVFIVAGSRRTFAQMSTTEKNRISHRGKAFQNLHRLVVATSSPHPLKQGEPA